MHNLLITKFSYWKWNIGDIEHDWTCPLGEYVALRFLCRQELSLHHTSILTIDIQQEPHEYILTESDDNEFDNIQCNIEEIQKQNIDIKKEVIDQEGRFFIFNPLIDNML